MIWIKFLNCYYHTILREVAHYIHYLYSINSVLDVTSAFTQHKHESRSWLTSDCGGHTLAEQRKAA
jgi:hypothetical protein